MCHFKCFRTALGDEEFFTIYGLGLFNWLIYCAIMKDTIWSHHTHLQRKNKEHYGRNLVPGCIVTDSSNTIILNLAPQKGSLFIM